MKKLNFDEYSALSDADKIDYRYEMAFDDLRRSWKTGTDIEQPTISGLAKSPRGAAAARAGQWELIERLCRADAREVFEHEQRVLQKQ